MAYRERKLLPICPFPRFQEQLLEHVEHITLAHEPLLVYRSYGRSVVVMGIPEFHALQLPMIDILDDQLFREKTKLYNQARYDKRKPKLKC